MIFRHCLRYFQAIPTSILSKITIKQDIREHFSAFLIFRNALGDSPWVFSDTLQTVYGSEMHSIARKYIG